MVEFLSLLLLHHFRKSKFPTNLNHLTSSRFVTFKFSFRIHLYSRFLPNYANDSLFSKPIHDNKQLSLYIFEEKSIYTYSLKEANIEVKRISIPRWKLNNMTKENSSATTWSFHLRHTKQISIYYLFLIKHLILFLLFYAFLK